MLAEVGRMRYFLQAFKKQFGLIVRAYFLDIKSY